MPRRLPFPPAWLPSLLAVALLAGCSAVGQADAPVAGRALALLPADALLLGEQHDAPEHHAIERETVEALSARGRLAALAIEMAEEGSSTAHLDRAATEAQVQSALGWDEKAWPWSAYGPAVMAAVRAGVPVLGANLPRARMKDAMADVSLDVQLGAEAHKAQREAVRSGHCNLLPESQIGPMTRVQIARDRAMAQTIVKARVRGKTVLLLSGAGHTAKALGVPQHLPSDLSVKTVQLQAGATPELLREPGAFDAVWQTPALPEKDYCAALRAQSAPRS
ncbi:putative iron-regulated protein [Variovorax sp. PBS-H4]|uniref:ChaN family lipoprotein n=1 Tax=Variovorax sp. PBS-H4 TaxID=434008 RepID=UPI001316B620|nr:ChaN family lipoprotein [Variovorax sp. PBS-H4]VTU20320.1 putative iron-regulated protein [Variovorax sp. PBS-H4]